MGYEPPKYKDAAVQTCSTEVEVTQPAENDKKSTQPSLIERDLDDTIADYAIYRHGRSTPTRTGDTNPSCTFCTVIYILYLSIQWSSDRIPIHHKDERNCTLLLAIALVARVVSLPFLGVDVSVWSLLREGGQHRHRQ